MVWALFALAGAIADAGYYALVKHALGRTDPYALAAGTFLATSAILLGVSLFHGIPAVGPGLLSAILVTGTLNIVASLLTFRALQLTDLSLAVPMKAFTLVFLIGTSFLFLGELPTMVGVLGILLIVAGSYVMHAGGARSLRDPLLRLVSDRGIQMMLVVAFIFSITLPFDKEVVMNSDPFFGSALVMGYIGTAMLCIALMKGTVPGKVDHRDVRSFLLIGAVLALEAIAINTAYTLQIVPYVIAIKRLAVLFAVLFGCLLFREEHLKVRLAGAVILLAGALLIILESAISVSIAP
ncbi:MAG: DMT family transporter [Methanomicrobiales archaeon]|nr:DMT family transporter [Methanomicrobiales archaeon]